jgi:myo-inositol-1(or 4)-monophosphatase
MNPDALLALADSIARDAGAVLLESFAGPSREVTAKSTPTDLVSAADLATERLIRERLAEARPYDAIMGEEGDDFEPEDPSGLRWVVDPLDGTTNFLFGIPQWAVSIAVQDADGRAVAGVVYDPPRGEMWAATRDGNATLDGLPTHGSQRADLATALVATGFGYDAHVREAQAAVIARLLGQVRDIRRLGSAALDLAWTAAGRYDAYFERGVQAWDVAAGQLICERAGLAVSQLAPSAHVPRGLLVASPALLGPLEVLL